MQTDHALLVDQVKSFMSTHEVTEAALAAKNDCAQAGIKVWLKSKQSPKVEKQYNRDPLFVHMCTVCT